MITVSSSSAKYLRPSVVTKWDFRILASYVIKCSRSILHVIKTDMRISGNVIFAMSLYSHKLGPMRMNITTWRTWYKFCINTMTINLNSHIIGHVRFVAVMRWLHQMLIISDRQIISHWIALEPQSQNLGFYISQVLVIGAVQGVRQLSSDAGY